jgi:hypothetical protein
LRIKVSRILRPVAVSARVRPPRRTACVAVSSDREARARDGAAGAARERAEAAGELLEREWLDHVVVGPEVERRDFVLQIAARREHQDRDRAEAEVAQALAQLQARQSRQRDVEDDHVARLARGALEADQAVRRPLDGVPVGLEVLTDVAGDVEVVLHQQNVHGRIPIIDNAHAPLVARSAPGHAMAAPAPLSLNLG